MALSFVETGGGESHAAYRFRHLRSNARLGRWSPGYEVIVTNEMVEDPHVFSQPVLSAHVLPLGNESGDSPRVHAVGHGDELEVIALEESGNQTTTAVSSETR